MKTYNDTPARIIVALLLAIGALAAMIYLQSCNVTRTVTTESHSVQRGDTSVTILSRTIETYDASKK